MHRLFIAIDLPADQRKMISEICSGLPGARWTPPDHIHLTLRFIGAVDGAVFREIAAALAGIKTAPLVLKVKGLGCFPPRRSPRVLWLGLERNEALLHLRNRIETALVRLGLEPEHRKFSPHITIARFKEPHLGKVADFLTGHGLFELPPFPAEEYHLYSSHLTSTGAIHQIEASYPVASP